MTKHEFRKEILGHDHAMLQLISSLQNGSICHSWLIYGDKGIGKISLVHEFIKFLLRSELDSSKIDYALSAIKQFECSQHPDIFTITSEYTLELEEKSNQIITVDEIRTLKHFLSLTPAQGKFRVAIINNSEHMNYSASNAMLKVLEEPPSNAIIFLICNSLGMLPMTVRSRCKLIRCNPLTLEDFQQVFLNLGHSLDLEEIKTLYDVSYGSVALAMQILNNDQIKIIDVVRSCIDQKEGAIKECINFAIHSQQNWEIIVRVLLNMLCIQAKVSAVSKQNKTKLLLEFIEEAEKLLYDCVASHLDRSHVLFSILSSLRGY